MPPAPGATAFKRGRPVALLHQTGQGKNTVAQIHAGGATPPPQIVLSGGDRDTGDGAQLAGFTASGCVIISLAAPPEAPPEDEGLEEMSSSLPRKGGNRYSTGGFGAA